MPREIKKSLQGVRELSKKAFHVLKDIELFWRCFEQAVKAGLKKYKMPLSAQS